VNDTAMYQRLYGKAIEIDAIFAPYRLKWFHVLPRKEIILDIDTWYTLLFLRSLLAAAMLAALVLSAGVIGAFKAWRAIVPSWPASPWPP
jgi:hypothetical protein